MAYNYSYSELQQMKEDAVRRVREMQRQAEITHIEKPKVEEEPIKVPPRKDTPAPPTPTVRRVNNTPQRRNVSGIRINGLRHRILGNPQRNNAMNQRTVVEPKKVDEPVAEPPIEPLIEEIDNRNEKRQPRGGGGIPLLNGMPLKMRELLDDDEFSEQALLLIVTFLLVNEKCDTALVLAMLYILSD